MKAGRERKAWRRSSCTARAGAPTAGAPRSSWPTSASPTPGTTSKGSRTACEVVQDRNDGKNIIPTIVFPDGSHLAEPTNEELAQKLGLQRQAMQHVYDLIIVGGGPTGLTTAIYAARENLETLIIDSKGLGGQAGVTERLDNYPGFPEGIGGAELADRFVQAGRALRRRDAAGRLRHEDLRGLGDDRRRGRARRRDGDRRPLPRARGPPRDRLVVPAHGRRGEDDLIGAGVHFCATCDGPFYKGSDELMVIGGGNSGLEEGVFLTQFTDKVTIVERGDRLRGSTDPPEQGAGPSTDGGELQHGVKEFRKKEDGSGKLGTVVIEDLGSGAIEEHHPAGVFVFIGLDPNTDFLKGTVDLDERGFVATDPTFMSSMPGVFAAGDVRDGSTKQLASAVGEGAAAAIQIRGYLDRLEQRGRWCEGWMIVMPMQPNEIFELIVKADEKLKYATADKRDAGAARRRISSAGARRGRRSGTTRLVQQAELRLPTWPSSPSSRGTPPAGRRPSARPVTCSSVSVPVARIVACHLSAGSRCTRRTRRGGTRTGDADGRGQRARRGSR